MDAVTHNLQTTQNKTKQNTRTLRLGATWFTWKFIISVRYYKWILHNMNLTKHNACLFSCHCCCLEYKAVTHICADWTWHKGTQPGRWVGTEIPTQKSRSRCIYPRLHPLQGDMLFWKLKYFHWMQIIIIILFLFIMHNSSKKSSKRSGYAVGRGKEGRWVWL